VPQLPGDLAHRQPGITAREMLLHYAEHATFDNA
jgi:hypothetical protein